MKQRRRENNITNRGFRLFHTFFFSLQSSSVLDVVVHVMKSRVKAEGKEVENWDFARYF